VKEIKNNNGEREKKRGTPERKIEEEIKKGKARLSNLITDMMKSLTLRNKKGHFLATLKVLTGKEDNCLSGGQSATGGPPERKGYSGAIPLVRSECIRCLAVGRHPLSRRVPRRKSYIDS